MLAFAAAVFLLIITPGPGVLSAAGVGAAYGGRAGLIYIVGLFAGTNMVALAVIFGLAAVLELYPLLRTLLFGISALFLLWIAAKVALAGARIAFLESPRPPGFLGGIALQAVNPKAYAVNTTLFAGFAFWPANLVAETVAKLVIVNALWIPIHLAWLGAGLWLHRLDLSHRVQRAINVTMALAMLAVVALAAWPSLRLG